MQPGSFSEIALMQRIEAREQAALSELYERYSRLVYGLALRILKQERLAEEVTQDTFLKVWQQANQWDATKGALATWLLVITRYTAIDRLRKEERRATWSAIDLTNVLETVGKRSEVTQSQGDHRLMMRSFMEALPPEQKQVIEMAFYEGYSHTEIAKKLNEPLGTVKSRVRLGLQKLKAMWIEASEEKTG